MNKFLKLYKGKRIIIIAIEDEFTLIKFSLCIKFQKNYNVGQKVGDKFTKLSKIDFSMECFTVDFLQFFAKKRQNLALGWTAGSSPSNPSISGIFLKFSNSLRS